VVPSQIAKKARAGSGIGASQRLEWEGVAGCKILEKAEGQSLFVRRWGEFFFFFRFFLFYI